MAPTKRPATATAGASKKRKVDVVGVKSAAIAKALLEHGTLPASTLSMLSSMTSCLTVPKDDRHAYQAEITSMIGEALSVAEAALAASVEESKGKVDNTAADKVARADACSAATTALEGLKGATADKKQALEEANTALKTAKAATAEAKKAQSEGDAVIAKAEAKKTILENAVGKLLAPLKERAATAKADKAALKKLVAIGKEYSFDESMLEMLPKAVKKEPAERGSFDTLTLAKLEEQFAEAIAELTKSIEEGQPGKEERAAAVAAAASAEEAAEAADKAAADALAEAKAAEKTGVAALREAEKVVKNWLLDTKDIMDNFDALTKTLSDFRSGPLSFYAELKDLVPPPPEPEEPEAAPEAEEEAPMASEEVAAQEVAAQEVAAEGVAAEPAAEPAA